MTPVPTLLLSTTLFPPIPWMAALIQFPDCQLEIHETWHKQTFRNRFTILSANGPLDLNVPVVKTNGNHTKTLNVLVSSHNQPLRKMKAAIDSAYQSSPYYEYFSDQLEHFFSQTYRSLIDMNMHSLDCISTMIRHPFHLKTSFSFISPDDLSETFIDLRYKLSPKNKHFYSFKAPHYYQVFHTKFPFVSNLSVLDLVMNMGPESILYLQKYPLKEFLIFLSQM